MMRELASSRRVASGSRRFAMPAAAVARVPQSQHPVLRLQQTVGNRVVARLVQSGRQAAPPTTGKPQPVPLAQSGQSVGVAEGRAGVPTRSASQSGKPKDSRRAVDEGRPGSVVAEATAGQQNAGAGPRDKPPAAAHEDPGYLAVVRQLKVKAAAAKAPVKSPDKKRTETVDAATLTEEEVDKQSGYKNHLTTLAAVQGLTVEQFMAQFEGTTNQLADALPKTKEEHDSDDAEAQLNVAGANAKRQAATQARAQSAPLQNETHTDPVRYKDERTQAAKPQKLAMDPVGAASEVKQTAPAAPKPKGPDEVSLEDRSRSLDDVLVNHSVGGQKINIEERSLTLPVSGEASFDQAGAAKRKAQEEIGKAVPRYRAEESKAIGKSQDDIQSAVDKGLQRQHLSRTQCFGDVLGKQNTHKTSLEEKKRKVFLEIEGIYNRTKTDVNQELAKLQGMDEVFEGILKEAQDYFDRNARKQLEYIYTPGTFDYSDWKDEHEKQIQEEYQKQKRSHEGGEYHFGLDPAYQEALKIVRDRSAADYFVSLRRIFIGDVNRGVEQKIAKPVVEALNAAKKHIQDGKEAAGSAFATLGAKEQEESQNVFDAVTGRFEQLEESVDDTQREVIGDLARTYQQSLGKLQSTFDEIKKDVLTSWWEKAWNKLKEIVNAIIDFASRIASLLGRLAYLIGDIISSPRAFFSNLVSGIGQGFSTFIGDIGKFLSTAFFDWLRGSSGVAVRMPSDLGPKGIFSLFTQLLDLSVETVWQRMEVVYDKTIANAFRRGKVLFEKGLGIFRTIKEQGLGGLWDEIRDSLGGILEETLETIKENVLYAAIKKVILEIGKMLIPGGGFIAIAEKVIRLLQFIVNARDKILDLIEAFVDSVEMAVKGDVGGIVNHITKALTKFITIALDFLVNLFGLGGIKNKVTGLIGKMRAPVIRGIDWVLNKFKPLVMKGKKAMEKGKEKLVGAGKAVVQAGVPKDPHERLKLATRASVAAARKLTGRVTQALLNPILGGIKVRYGLQALQPYEKGGTWWVRAAINPTADANTGVSSGAPTSQAGAQAGSGGAPQPEGHGAPGIGSIGLHGGQPPSLRNGPKIWHLESEHIIPFATGKRLWEVISLVVPGRGGREDNRQTTIMIYYEAARFKTPVDNRISGAFEAKVTAANAANRMRRARSLIEAGHSKGVRSEVGAVLGLMAQGLRAAQADAVERTNAAIISESNMKMEGNPLTNAERRGPPGAPEAIVPSPTAVAQAAEAQYDNIFDLARSEIEATDILR